MIQSPAASQQLLADSNFSRQPDFESVKHPQSLPNAIPPIPMPHSGNGRSAFNDSGISEQVGGGPNKVMQSFDSMANNFHRTASGAVPLEQPEQQSASSMTAGAAAVPEDQWQSIIDWVNSFNDSSCLLVSNYKDFSDGIALCHIVATVACNKSDQAQMRQLVHHEHNFDPIKMQQNVELALNVLQASTISLPDIVQKLTAEEILNSEVHCYMFLETLRQAKNLGIIQVLEDRSMSPIKMTASAIQNDLYVHTDETNVLQQSPIELKSSKKAQQRPGEETDIVPIDQQSYAQSIQEIVQIDTTIEPSAAVNQTDAEAVLSPTFQPEKLQALREQLPLQMDSQSQRSANRKVVDKSGRKSIQLTPNQQGIPLSVDNSVEINRSRAQQQRTTQHSQDSNYKPLFTDSVSQKKKLQELQFQIMNYDRVIQNSYDRLSASKQVQSIGNNQINQENHNISGRGTARTSQNNADLTEIAKEELIQLDRMIEFEKDLERQLPFNMVEDGHKRHSVGGDGGSTPRMESPRRQPQGNLQHQNKLQIAERADKPTPIKFEGTKAGTPVDDIDQIMQQMQTLNIEKNEVEVQPVDEKTKIKLLHWLVDDVKLISNQVNPAKLMLELPKYCRNGVLFGDLINRLRGREDVIKGIHRTPKNMTAINANFDKVLSFLKEFPRFSSRYLWSQKLAIEGNNDVIWGLLDDIWHWHMNKISIHDPAQSQQPTDQLAISRQSQSQKTQNQQSLQTKNLSMQLRTSSSSGIQKQQDSLGGPGPHGHTKMRDYLRNGEQAQFGLRASTQQSLTLSPRSKPPKSLMRPRNLSTHKTPDIVTEDATGEKYKHNFNPSIYSQQKQSQLQEPAVQFTQEKNAQQENYHSFGIIQNSLGGHQYQPVPPLSALSNLKPCAEIQNNKNNNNSVPLLKRPPKAPPQISYLGAANATKNNMQVKRSASGGDISARSYSGVASARKQAAQSSQFESPRSYSGAFRSHRQYQQSGYSQANHIPKSQRPLQSARNRQNMSHHNMFSVASNVRNTNSASRSKAVHMRTSQEYHNQSMIPFTNQTSSHQKPPYLLRSLDSTSTNNHQQRSLGITKKFTPQAEHDAEKIVDDWLAHLKFHPFMSQEFEFVSLTEDPKRNGIFVAELVAYLLPQSTLAQTLNAGTLIKQRPANVADCQKNWQNIFNVLSQLYVSYNNSAKTSASQLTRFLTKQKMQELMQGQKPALYKLLFSFYQAFYESVGTTPNTTSAVDEYHNQITATPMGHQSSACHSSIGGGSSTMECAQSVAVGPLVAPVEISRRRMTPSNSATSTQQALNGGSQSDIELPYTPDELTQLDLSIVQWLKEIGQLKALSIDFEKVDSVLDLQAVLSNGVLLCALVSRVFKTRITGVFKDPKTETTCLSNIRKAMKVLQTSRKMSQKFSWTEKQVFEGQRNVILGLFEDIHRAFDGLPPRKRGQTYFDDGPYLGARFQEQYLQQYQEHKRFQRPL